MQIRKETEWLGFQAALFGVAAMVIALALTLLLVAVTVSESRQPRVPSVPAGPSVCLMEERPVPCS